MKFNPPLKIENNQPTFCNSVSNYSESAASGSFEFLAPPVHLFFLDHPSGHQGKHDKPQQSFDEEEEEPGESESLESLHVGYNPGKGASVQVANLP